MIKFMAFYTIPKDKEAFDKHYFGTHIPLCEKLPNIQRVEVSRFTGGMGGAEPPYYIVAELCFNSKEEMDASFATPEGRAVGKDTRNIEPGLMTAVYAETVE